MPELRWILLGLGALFCLGLWWWEARRGRQAADSRAGLNPVEGLNVPTAVRDAPRRPTVEPPIIERELPSWNDAADAVDEDDTDEVTPAFQADDADTRAAPHDLERLETDEPRERVPAARDRAWEANVDQRSAPEASATRLAAGEPAFSEFEPYESPGREPMIDIAAERPQRLPAGTWERIEPVIGDAAAAVRRAAPVQPPPVQAPAPPAVQPEKIVALRVAAPPLERFEGRTLVAALSAAGLEHGKFSIFHKHAADGTELFSVASLVEPGTFDLQALDGRRFPGVSFFAVLTPDRDGSATLEDMLGTARTLAGSLHGMLQDERGAPLSPQRLADLRADVAAWVRRAQ